MNFIDRSRKRQVTPFILVGILIVIIAGAILFINRDEISRTRLSVVQTDPVRDYVEECMQEVLDDSLAALKANAGYINAQVENSFGVPNIHGLSYLTSASYRPNYVLERGISDDV